MKFENTTDIIISVMGMVVIPLTSLTPPHYCASTKPVPGFPTSYVMVFFCVRWFEVRDGCTLCWYW